MDAMIAILKDNKVINALYFSHDPSIDEINQFVELHGGSTGRKLTEYEIVNNDNEIEERVQPYPSWLWDSTNRQWLPPAYPTDPSFTFWNETEQAWTLPE